jgi:hypothetical protein
MKRPPMGRKHLDARVILDYLEDRLGASAKAGVEDHLAGSCSRCRELLHQVGRLVDAMRADRTPPVPAVLRARALEAFGVRERAPETQGLAWRVARLLFDSLADPLPAAVRRAVGEARWLRFELDPHRLEIEAEPETQDSVTVRGRLSAPEPALYRIDLETGGEALSAWPDSGGRFALERVPAGQAIITVKGPAERWRLPPVTL